VSHARGASARASGGTRVMLFTSRPQPGNNRRTSFTPTASTFRFRGLVQKSYQTNPAVWVQDATDFVRDRLPHRPTLDRAEEREGEHEIEALSGVRQGGGVTGLEIQLRAYLASRGNAALEEVDAREVLRPCAVAQKVPQEGSGATANIKYRPTVQRQHSMAPKQGEERPLALLMHEEIARVPAEVTVSRLGVTPRVDGPNTLALVHRRKPAGIPRPTVVA
jgi:hypothetical protein